MNYECLVISEELNLGTFCGTLTHKDWYHWGSNIIFIIPFWIYLDNKVGKAFVVVLVFTNMIFTGLYGLVSGQTLCGLSGVVYMFIGFSGIIGNWLCFFFAIIMFCTEISLLRDEDGTSHVAHIIFFIAGVVIGIIKIAWAVL